MVKIPARAADSVFLPNGSNLEIGLSIQQVNEDLIGFVFQASGDLTGKAG
jgi:hypothetical protein